MWTNILASLLSLVLVFGSVNGDSKGCYKEDKNARVYSISPGDYNPMEMTIMNCAAACGELTLKYAALTYGKFCFCGNADPSPTKENSNGCQTPCSGDSSEKCGDKDHVSIHESAQQITSLSLSIHSQVKSQVTFSVIAEPEVISMDYAIDYGDGSGPLRTTKNSTNMFVREYVLPGQFAAILYASGHGNTAPETQAVTTVSIAMPPTNASIECPKLAATHEEIECNVTITDGISLRAISNVGDKQPDQQYAIADATRFVAGSEISIPSAAALSQLSGTYLVTSSEFQWDGVLVGWEVYGLTKGTIHMLILKPVCTREYCYTSRSCGDCQPGMAYKCTNVVFRSGSNLCGNQTISRAEPASTFTYIIVYRKRVTIDIGYNYISLSGITEVKAGYIIGFEKKVTGEIAANTVTEGQDRIIVTSLTVGAKIIISATTKSPVKHIFRAIASRRSVLSLFHTYSSVGDTQVTVHVIGDQNNITLSAPISVQEGIDQIQIDASKYQETQKQVTYHILQHTGNNVTYEWNFGDGHVVNNTLDQMGHIYNKPGTYNFTIVGWNQLSRKENFTVVIAEDAIKGLKLDALPVSTMKPASISISKSSGSDFTCQLSFGDGPANEILDPTNFVLSVTKTHKYQKEGSYQVVLTCANNVSKESVEAEQKVIDPITEMKLVEEGVLVGETKPINFSIATGSQASFTMSLDGKAVPIKYNEANKIGTTKESIKWPVRGTHTVILTGRNLVSNVTITVEFVVELELTGVKMIIKKNKIMVGGRVTFGVSAQSGTNVHIDWLFGDGVNETFTDQTSLDWTPGKTESRTHTFQYSDNYKVIVTVYNKQKEFSFIHHLVVLAPIENLTMESDSPIKFTPPGEVNFKFVLSSKQKPAGAMLNISYGDGKSDSNLPFDLLTIYKHLYDDINVYNVKATVANELSGVDFTTVVNIIEPIEKIEIKPQPPHASLNQSVDILVTMYRGGNDKITITWDLGDGTVKSTPRKGKSIETLSSILSDGDKIGETVENGSNYQPTVRKIGRSPDVPDKLTHTYTSIGSYTITVSVENPLGVFNKSYEIVCQNPVLSASITSDAPATYVGQPSIIMANMTYSGVKPTDASMYWDDGTEDSKKTEKPFREKDQHMLTYTKPGNYIAKIVIFNLASKKEFEFSAGVFKKITTVEVAVKYKPKLPLNAMDKSGFTTSKYLPFDRPVKFYVTSDGTVVNYKATLTKNNKVTHCNNTMSPFVCEFPEAGTYEVNITASNPLPSASSQVVQVRLLERVTDMILDMATQSKANHETNLTVSFPTIGDITCMVVNFGDGSVPAVYGNSMVCPDLYKSDANENVKKVMMLSYKYAEPGTYMVNVLVLDTFGSITKEKSTVITTVNCETPIISIKDIHSEFTDPLIVKRDKLARIITNTKISCKYTLKNFKLWTVFNVNPLSGKVDANEIDMSQNPSINAAELALQPRSLLVGLYKVIYTVTMDQSKFPNKEVFQSSSFTYIKMQKPKLIGIMEKGGSSERLWGHNTKITLSPEKYSYDPNIARTNKDQGFTDFIWYCKSSDQVTYSGELSGPSDAIHSDKGGCFGQGPGKINFTTGEIKFSTEWMKVNQSYDIMATIVKDERKVNTTLSVKIVDGVPGSALIQCSPGICSQASSGQYVNPSARLGFTAKCESGCKSDKKLLKYEWKLYYFQYRWNWRHIENITKYTIGHNSQFLAVYKTIFQDFPVVEKFRVKVTITDEPANTRAETSMNILVNKAPHNGSCSISPKTGNTGETYFNLSCSNWVDDQKVEQYMFYAKFNDSTLLKQIAFGSENKIQVYMPLGPDYDNYKMQVFAKIFDTFGAYTVKNMGVIQVNPISQAKLADLMATLSSGTMETLELAVANGDLQETNTVFSVLASALNSASKKIDKETYANKSERVPSGYGRDYDYRSAEEYVEVSEADYQEKQANKFDNKDEMDRDLRAKGRAKMAEALNTVTVSTMSGIQLTASTLSSVCKYTEECGREAQKAVAINIGKMADTFKDLGTDTPMEELGVAGESMMAIIGETLEATNYHIKDPILTDMDSVADTMVYDTDLDSEQETISSDDPAKALNELKYIANKEQQTKGALEETKKILGSLGSVKKTLSKAIVPGEQPLKMNTPKMAISLAKASASALSNKTMGEGRGGFKLPDWCKLKSGDCDSDEVVSLQVMATPGNIFSFAKNKAVSDKSGTMSINFMSDSEDDISISGTTEPIEIVIPRDQSFKGPNADFIDPILVKNETLFFHTFWANNTNSSIHVEIRPDNASVQLLVFVAFNHTPNITTKEWDYFQMVPTSMELAENYTKGSWPNPYMVFVSDKIVGNFTGRVYLGVRQLEPEEMETFDFNATIPDFKPHTGNFTTNYTLRTFTSGCLYFKETISDWVTDGCHVGSETNISRTQCFCNHMTAFSAGLMVAPNTIDWDRVLNNASFAENPTLYITQIVILLIYLASAGWSIWQDKKDMEKLGLTPLKCNNPNDKYYYEIIVATGMRKDSGTTSKACFILSGEYDETEVRSLSDDKRQVLQRGGNDGFLMAVRRPLGALSYARIWHDNSGKGKFASWYLKHFLVRDLQTGMKYHFIVNKWFAVEEDDGQVDRIIPIAGKEQLLNFSHMFAKRAQKNLGDGHLWFSVVGRPPGSPFTRLQRVSCCLCLLFTSMFANALYYDRESGGGAGFSFGPFSMSIETISMGFVSNLIVLPVNLAIVTLFRKSKPRKEKPSRIEQALKEGAETSGVTSVNDVQPLVMTGWDDMSKSQTNFIDAEKGHDMSRPGTSMSRPYTPVVKKNTTGDKDKKKKKFMLPWWCRFISWFLLWLTVAGCCAGVTFYGITFGNEKTTKWISSMLISFFSSVFITEPIKVFGMAILFSLILKNPAEDEEGEDEDETLEMGEDEEFLHSADGYGAAKPKMSAYKPPDEVALGKMRKQRLNEIKMWEVIKEIIFYAFFLWILMVISYRNRSPWAYRTKAALENMLVKRTHDFTAINNTQAFWAWAKNELVDGLRATKYYNGAPPVLLRGYMQDKTSRIMGYAVMRQLRATSKTCKVAKQLEVLGLDCHNEYSLFNEDGELYGIGWNEPYYNNTYSNLANEFLYQDSSKLDGYPFYGNLATYGGGGYVAQLKGSKTKLKTTMERLQNSSWIDKLTRAVFIEFTVYNPQVNLFTVCTMLAEFTRLGGVVTSYRFEPCMLLPYMTKAALVQILCDVIFIIFLIYFLIKEVRLIIKLRKNYIKDFWNLVELGIVSLSIAGMFIFIYKLLETTRLTKLFRKTQGNKYMKFQYVAFWNELFGIMVGWLVFLATLKFMKLLRFNKRMSMLSSTLSNSAPSLFNFSLVFWIFFLAFVQVFYLLFFREMSDFAGFITSAETALLMMMGKFNFARMKQIQPILCPLIFCLFVITITFILVNMFLSILNETFASVKADLHKQSNDYELVNFMVGRFKTWTGIGMSGAVSPEDNSKKSKADGSDNPQGQIENFPDKVDQLLNSISQVYMENDTFEAFFDDRSEAGKVALKKFLNRVR